MTDRVRISAYKPGSRWAVGPRDPTISPALPFYTRAGAEKFYDEVARELPEPDFQSPVLYRKRLGMKAHEVPR